MTVNDVSRDYVKQMRELGYRDLLAGMLIRLKTHGVSAGICGGNARRGTKFKRGTVD